MFRGRVRKPEAELEILKMITARFMPFPGRPRFPYAASTLAFSGSRFPDAQLSPLRSADALPVDLLNRQGQ